LNFVKSNTSSGLAFAFAGFALLSCGDALVKSMAGVWPGTAVAALRYGFGVLLLGSLLFVREGRNAFNIPRPWVQFGRGASVSVGSICFFLSIYVMPLAEATLIQFVIPMLVAIISRIFLNERTPRAAWIATAFAFAGVLIVLRPQVASIGWHGVLPLIGALGLSFMMIFNRMASGLGSALKMQFLISIFAFPVLALAAIAGHFSGFPASRQRCCALRSGGLLCQPRSWSRLHGYRACLCCCHCSGHLHSTDRRHAARISALRRPTRCNRTGWGRADYRRWSLSLARGAKGSG
jgi:drug/metabolite transporter (DMT)-like permease